MIPAIHPYTRIAFLIFGIVGTIICSNNLLLLFFWLIFLIPIIIITGNWRIHFRFLLIVVLPMSVMLFFLFSIEANNNKESLNIIIRTILKLVAYTTIVQITLVIPLKHVYSTFKMWGMKGVVLVTFLGSYIVWVDVINRSIKILTARFARGFIIKRTIISSLKQIPHLLIPLVIGILRTATERAESWEQKRLLERIEVMEIQTIEYNIYLNTVILLSVSFWLLLNMFLRWIQ